MMPEVERILRKQYSPEQLQQMFVNRTNDEIFRTVGDEYLAYSPFRPDHITVWCGYEQLTDSKYAI